MADIETKIEVEDFTEELSDEALDREGARMLFSGLGPHACLGN